MAETQNIPPLVYSQLRMLAEAAVGIPTGETATFVLDPAGTDSSPSTNILGPEILLPGAPWPGQGVLVPARHRTKFADPGSVTVQVDGAAGPGVNAVAYRADALFWSDASVQKFVLPYYTSCMGYEAYDRLATLQEAWNGSHDGIRVLALMHVTGAPLDATGQISPVEPFWVVYLQEDQDEVVASSLADFSRDNPATLPPLQRPAPQPYVAPDPGIGTPYPDYVSLRSMAEWAASLSTETRYFWYNTATGDFVAPTTNYDSQGLAIVIPVLNPFVPADRLGSRTLSVAFGGETLPDDVDAVFWSTGAIEQFLMPYYASIDGFNGLTDLQALRTAWQDNVPTLGGNRLVDGVDTPLTGPADGEVLGILHFLRTMFETDPAPPAAGTGTTSFQREVGLIHTGASGPPEVVPPSAVTAAAAA